MLKNIRLPFNYVVVPVRSRIMDRNIVYFYNIAAATKECEDKEKAKQADSLLISLFFLFIFLFIIYVDLSDT
jgi:hypothetical protein